MAIKVLVCDDDPIVRSIARRTLEDNLTCEVRECSDGSEVLLALTEDVFSFLVLDLAMPGLSGVETLQAIRDNADTEALPVIILTAERDEAVVRTLLALGIADYLLKPLRPMTLVAKVEALMQRLDLA